MSNLRIKKPWGEILIPKKQIDKIRKELGEEGVRVFQLLCELADDNGEIHFDGDMYEQLATLYEARFTGDKDA
jgi:hypothetical protein